MPPSSSSASSENANVLFVLPPSDPKDYLLPEDFLPSSFEVGDTTWKRGAKLSVPKRLYDATPYEGRSVYECESGNEIAIMKIRWQ